MPRPQPTARSLTWTLVFPFVLAEACVRAPAPPAPPVEGDLVNLELIWVSHRHVDVEGTPFHQAGVNRSLQEARGIAYAALTRLRETPATFAAIAREVSDDAMSRQHGGAMGMTPLDAMPSELADVVAVLAPDQLSDVIETPHGFYVFHRAPDVANERLSAASIYVTWTDSESLVRPAVPRSKEEAHALAIAAHMVARAVPERFADFVDRFSDDRERARQQGWEGVWSSVAAPPENFPHVTQAVLALKVGEVSPVIEGPDGFFVLRRLALVEPPQFAATEIVISYEGATLEDAAARPVTRSRVEAESEAARIARRLREDPAAFDAEVEVSSDSPSAEGGGRRTWSKGRLLAAVDAAIEGARVGEIVGPIDTPLGFAVYRRDPLP